MPPRQQAALTGEERNGIVLAVQSAFTKLKNLHREIVPIFQQYGFTTPSPGVIARDLSEKIEASIIQHCESFSKGTRHCDLSRADHDWEVKICKASGLTINQSKQIAGENYIVVNYKANSQVTRIFVLWDANDAFFSARRSNANARALLMSPAQAHIETLYNVPRVATAKTETATTAPHATDRPRVMAKAGLRATARRRSS